MELSEAIRIGSEMRPQCYGAMYGFYDHTNTLGTCALGAAYEGAGISMEAWDGDNTFRQKFPIVKRVASCPGCKAPWMTGTILSNIVMHLNDAHRWSRGAIAMWVETIEKARDAETSIANIPYSYDHEQETSHEEVCGDVRPVQGGRLLRAKESVLCVVRPEGDAVPGLLADVCHLLGYVPGAVAAGCAEDYGASPGGP